MTVRISDEFPRYTQFDPAVPVWCITPNIDRCVHRFFDSSPLSPSGRYAALTRLPYEDRLPTPGDLAEIVLVDLQAGTGRIIAKTAGWDTQLGAQAQWGVDDSQLLFNDCDTSAWRPFGVRMNLLTGERTQLQGTVYMVSPDGTQAASPCLLRTARTQAGYGVIAPDEAIPHNSGAVDYDGVYLTDTQTGESRLLVSLRQIVDATDIGKRLDQYGEGGFYGAHVKWNPQGDRIMLVLRWMPADPAAKMKPNVITLAADGSDIHLAIPDAVWGTRRGHHPNWCPDGEHVMMNMAKAPDDPQVWLVRARYDGSDYQRMTAAVPGSGHPSLHPNGRHVITDCYVGGLFEYEDHTVPLRLIDLAQGSEEAIVRINTVPGFRGPLNELRVDPHPAWNRRFERIVFNAYPDGTRRVFVADLADCLGRS